MRVLEVIRMDIEKCAKFLAQLRKEHNLTQLQLSEMVYVSRESVSKWERGVNLPDHDSLLLLSKIYGLTVNELLYGEYLTEHNKEAIDNTTVEVIKLEQSKRAKIIKISGLIITILLILFFALYFITNYNSIRMYILSGEGKYFQIQQGSIVTFQDKTYIQFGEMAKDLEEDITDITLYYKDGKEKEIISSNNDLYLLNGDLSKNSVIKEYKMKDIIKNLYLEINTTEHKDTIKLSILLDHTNSMLFPYIDGSEHGTTKESAPIARISNNLLDKFKLVDEQYIYKTKKHEYIYDEGLNRIIVKGQKIVYNIDTNTIMFGDDKACDLSNEVDIDSACLKYKDLVEEIKKDLFE